MGSVFGICIWYPYLASLKNKNPYLVSVFGMQENLTRDECDDDHQDFIMMMIIMILIMMIFTMQENLTQDDDDHYF